MGQLRISDTARKDLDDIWWYIAQENPVAADSLIARLLQKLPTLASMPQMGRKRDDLFSGLRSFPVGDYVIFYSPLKDGVEVVRVLHGARDLPPLFGSSPGEASD
jgi:toxin ParE1/3/4